MTLAIVLCLVYCYLIAGVLFASWFVLAGVNKLDSGMTHAPWGVRALIFPGSVLLWIVLLMKYRKIR